VNALLVDETRPHILPVDEGILLILRGVNLSESVRPEDMVSIRLWIGPHRIISPQRRELQVVGDLAANIEVGQGPFDCGIFQIYDKFCLLDVVESLHIINLNWV
jgi:zinc transporter